MKLLIVFILGCLPLSANAIVVQPSPECISKAGEYTVKFHGQSFIAALETYYAKISFEPGKLGFKFETNWGSDVKDTVDFENLTEDWIYNFTTFPSYGQVSCYATPESCVESMSNTLTYLRVAKRFMVNNGDDLTQKIAALDCAISRSLLFTSTVQEKIIRTRQVNQ